MVKLVSLGLLLWLQTALSALAIGNPAEPQLIEKGFFTPDNWTVGMKLGYQGNFVFDRKLRAFGGAKGRIDHFKTTTNQGVLTLGYFNRLEVYGSFGAISTHFWNRPRSDGKRREFETHDHWIAGGGACFLLAEWGNTGIGVDGKAQVGRPAVKWASVDGAAHASGAHVRYHEWQVSFAAYHTVDMFTPYIGLKYSNVHADVEGISQAIYSRTHFKMHSRVKYGMALGCSVTPNKKIDLNVEVQLIDEQAITIGGNLKF